MGNRRILHIIFSLFFLAGIFTACNRKAEKSFDINQIESYLDIPGVNEEDIKEIEALKSVRRSFSFGSMPTTEAFILPDGTYCGFATLFCDLLSGLFGIPFVQEFDTWESLKTGIDNGTIDFTGELTPTPERRLVYFMSHSIAERSLAAFTFGDTVRIKTENDLEGLRIGSYEGTITIQSIYNTYPSINFESVPVNDNSDVAEMLENGEIDVFVMDAVDSYYFSSFPSIKTWNILPLIYTPVSLATTRPELKPVISVLNKYIEAGGIDRLYELYKEGSEKYARFNFSISLSDEEKAYLEKLSSDNSRIPVALEGNNYPICFYNEKEHKFQGIAPDILEEISLLTGLQFEAVTEKSSSWASILEKLRNGEVALVSELQFTEERKDNFLWTDPYTSSHYTLLSKSDYPNLEMYQIVRATVGLVKDSAYEELYKSLFPNNYNYKFYGNQSSAMAALEHGEIDLLMWSEYGLLSQTNFHEKPGFKTNIIFNTPLAESSFGFNLNEKILCSIIQSAEFHIDRKKIEKDWTGRVFDYSRKIISERLNFIFTFAAFLLLILIIMIVLLINLNNTNERYKNQMTTVSTIYKSLPDIVFSKDTSGLYTSCNHSMEEFTGYPESKIIGLRSINVFPHYEEMADSFIHTDNKVLNDHSTIKVEEWLTYPDGSTRLFETIKSPLMRDDKIIGLLGIARDITEHKTAENAANEASKAKTNFLARMSHEIRTPMNAIIGMTELAIRENELEQAKKHIYTVKQAAANLLSIINDILDFSKIEMGKLEITPVNYLFSSLVNDVISIIRMKVIDSQVRFAVNIDSKIPNALFGDESRIRQILLNLLSNAIKFTESGFVSFTVYGEIIDESSLNLIMEIMDSGKGIKQEDIDKLFNEYVQFDAEKNRGIEGTGLGLVITKNIIKAMDGDINVYSEYRKGSTFTVTLPQKYQSSIVLASVLEPEKKSVIVYERREIYANSMVFTIDNLGVNCTLVSSDSELLDKLSAGKYAFIFISFALFSKNRSVIYKHAPNSQIVVLSEFGEAVPDDNFRIIAMPVHSLSVANVLNNVSESYSYSENNELIVRFNAPDAHILVVDDINTNLKVAEGLLMPYNMHVDLCKSGLLAIKSVKAQQYDIILMDHKMPGMDGIETTRSIRALGEKDPYYKNVPIIALTANAVSGTKEMFLENGFNDFLSKPIDTVKLNAILEKWLARDKMKGPAIEKNKPYSSSRQKARSRIEIEGVDTEKGIFISGGTEEIYLEVLSIFYKDGCEKIKQLKSCLEKNNLPLYTVHVHALKTALANIGAVQLSKKAETLEMAGDHGDPYLISSLNPVFLSELETLLTVINLVLSEKIRGYGEKKEPLNIEELKRELNRLKTALESLDANTINITIEKLREITAGDDVGTAINNISNNVLVAEYDRAIDIIVSLL